MVISRKININTSIADHSMQEMVVYLYEVEYIVILKRKVTITSGGIG